MSSIAPDSSNKLPDEFVVANVMQEIPPEDEHVGETPLVYMNLTPLIDMVFNLLFFFVMGAGGAGDSFLQSKLPKEVGPSTQSPPPIKEVKVQIHRMRSGSEEIDAQYRVENKAWVSSYEQLYHQLEQLKHDVGDEIILSITPEHNVQFVHAVNVFNQATRAGFKKVGWSSPD